MKEDEMPTEWCMQDTDEDPLGIKLEGAINTSDTSGLAAIAACYRARWNEAKGKLEAIERFIAAKDDVIEAKSQTIAILLVELARLRKPNDAEALMEASA